MAKEERKDKFLKRQMLTSIYDHAADDSTVAYMTAELRRREFWGKSVRIEISSYAGPRKKRKK